MARDLMEQLSGWDRKTTDALRPLVGGASPGDLVACLAGAPDRAGTAASWVLGAQAEAGQIDSALFAACLDPLEQATSWETRLHLLQMARHVPLTRAVAARLAALAARDLSHDRPFLRAWALDALVRAAAYAPEWDDAARAALARCAADPAKSVQARARRLSAEGVLP